MTKEEDAQEVLESFKKSVEEGHPWLPGNVFTRLPGLDKHIAVSLEVYASQARLDARADALEAEFKETIGHVLELTSMVKSLFKREETKA